MQWILEAIFARLGVRHQSRNFGNGGLGTAHNAIGAGSIYGPDVDILMWDSGMTEKGNGFHQLFTRQGLMGGIKVPFLLSSDPGVMVQLHNEADADIGYSGSSMSGIPTASTAEELGQIPWAPRYMKCSGDVNEACNDKGYNGTCWVERDDFTPERPQKAEPAGRASWHPGNRVHQLKGRNIAFMILRALHEALDEWSKAEGQVLADEVWHVTSYYDNIRSKAGGFECEFDKGFGFLCSVPFKVSEIFGLF